MYTLFRTARPKNHTLSSGTSPYSPNKGVSPPPRACYQYIGRVYVSLRECVIAEEYLKKALSISKDSCQPEFKCYLLLALTKLSEQKFEEAGSYLAQSAAKFEELRGLLKDSDTIRRRRRIKISFDKNALPYKLLSSLFCDAGFPRETKLFMLLNWDELEPKQTCWQISTLLNQSD